MRVQSTPFSAAISLVVLGAVFISAAPGSAAAAAIDDIHSGVAHVAQQVARRQQALRLGKCNGVYKTPGWYVNEATNSYGSNLCRSDCDCDGQRYCQPGSFNRPGVCAGYDGRDRGQVVSPGYCNGAYKTAQWKVNEATNSYGPNQCVSDCDCDGVRYCSRASCTAGCQYGSCQGVARQ